MSHDHSKHDTISADDIGETMKAPGSGEDLPDNRLAIGHLEAILRTVSDGYWIIDHRDRIQDANDSLARMLGYSRGELLAQSVSDLEAVETSEVSRRITRIQEQGYARFESQLRRKDGRIIDIEASASYLDADSHQIFAFIRDITEQKQSERALQKLAHDLGERVKELSCLHGISDLAEIPGITLEEIVAGTVDLIPLAWQYPEITCARIVLKGQEFKTENYVRSPWQQMASILAHGEQIGKVEVGYLEEMPESDEGPFLKDEKALLNTIAQRVGEISESRQGQRRIGQQHRFLENILDSLPHPFYVINTRDLTVELANSAAQANGVAGELTCFALTHGRDLPCDLEEHPCPLHEVIRTRKPVVVEHVHIDGDGARRDVEVHGYPVFDLEGNLVQMIEYALDITERKQAEEAVRESETLLRETGRMAKVGGWELDSKGNSVAWTEEVYRIHEVPSDFRPNLESALSFYAPEDRPILEQAMGRAADTGEPWDLELGFITAKGKHLWVRAIGKAEHEDGELVKLSGTFQDITERKQAEEALRESEMRWRSLTQTSPDHILMVDTDLRIQFANFASPGLAVEELIGTALYALVDREKQAEVRAILEGAVKAGQPTRYETVYHPLEGEDIYYESHVTPRILPGSDEVVGLTVSSRDITVRKRAEQELRDSEERLRALFEILPVGVSVLDGSRQIRFANPALARILRLSKDELQRGAYEARTYLRADGSVMQPNEFPTQRAFEEDRLVRDVEICVVMADGERIWTNVSAVPLQSADWRVIATTSDITDGKLAEAALKQARDELEMRVEERTAELKNLNVSLLAEIAERKRAEGELQASEERFRQLAENTEDIIWLMEPDNGRLLYVSPAYERVLGQPDRDAPETIGQLWADVHPEDLERIPHDRVETWIGQEIEFRITLPGDNLRWIRARVFPVHDEKEQIYRVVGIASDITDEKHAQAALIEAERLAIAARMAASLAHEINNPLQAAIGCLDLSLEQIEQGKEPQQHLQVTAQALDRASRVVAQLRALHRPAEPEQKEALDLNNLLENMLVLIQKRCQDQQVDVVWQAAPDLPRAPLMPDAIQQVLLNLLLNALDAMPDGGQLWVSTGQSEEPSRILAQVRDTGTGIPAEGLDRLFEPFHSTKPNSLGLGLFISHNIVQDHGGQIEVESREGEGTTFRVWLPLSDPGID